MIIACKARGGTLRSKIEVKIRRINAANGSGRCIWFWQRRIRRRQNVYTNRWLRSRGLVRAAGTTTMALLSAATLCAARAGVVSIAPAKLKAIGTVDPRFQSYNIEMTEVTGGQFWKPYPRTMRAFDARHRYGTRPPIDLANARLRKLAAALAPAYLRVSGTWANATFFADVDPAPAKPRRDSIPCSAVTNGAASSPSRARSMRKS
ncbi:hypothetical protein ACTGJ9_014210 [Bradyrhizobium sp. RDM12]